MPDAYMYQIRRDWGQVAVYGVVILIAMVAMIPPMLSGYIVAGLVTAAVFVPMALWHAVKALKLHPACRDVAQVSTTTTGPVLVLTDGRRLSVSSVKVARQKIVFTAAVPAGGQIIRTVFRENYTPFPRLQGEMKRFETAGSQTS